MLHWPLTSFFFPYSPLKKVVCSVLTYINLCTCIRNTTSLISLFSYAQMLQYFYAVDFGETIVLFLTCARLVHNVFSIFLYLHARGEAEHTPGTRHTIYATHKFSQQMYIPMYICMLIRGCRRLESVLLVNDIFSYLEACYKPRCWCTSMP